VKPKAVLWPNQSFSEGAPATVSNTNPLERTYKGIKRRANVVRILPNCDGISPLMGALEREQSREERVTRRYMSQESLWRVRGARVRQDWAGWPREDKEVQAQLPEGLALNHLTG
jgi:transposase-like protein